MQSIQNLAFLKYSLFSTFDSNNQLIDRTPIAEPVILFTKKSKMNNGLELQAAYGASQFYLPHGIFVDDSGYVYTTDVGSHQVIKWKISGDNLEQVFAWGKQFEHGSDKDHFCKPAAVAVSRIDGSVFVADGYCNNRVMHFAKDGKFIAEFGHQSPYQREGGAPPLGTFRLPHDISIDESQRKIFVADRENGRVQIFNEQGDALEEIVEPSLFRNVYSAHFCPGKRVLICYVLIYAQYF
jgi:DNA-binding beta-propeller fold protein YncE